MDRKAASSSSRSSKTKLNLPQSELYALGSKASSSSRDDGKNKNTTERKREATTSLATAAAKKIKLSTTTSGPSKSSGDSSSSSSVLEYWEQVALDCEGQDLVSSVLTAIEQQDSDSVVGYICGAIKAIISPRSKTESLASLSLLYLAKIRPHLFCNETITSALVSILKRDSTNSFKGRNNPSIHILACNLLSRGYYDKKQWPESFVRAYIDDAINERVWVDYEECVLFVDNITAAFGTKTPPKWMLQPELSGLNPTGREGAGVDDEVSTDSTLFGENSSKFGDSTTENHPRYAHLKENVEKLVLDAIKEQFNKRQAPDCSTRNFLKFLASTTGLVEVRALSVTRLEMWIHNGKLMKPAQELLTFLCYNVTGSIPKDHEVLSNLVKMRLKPKPLINIFMTCLKETINCQPDILVTMLRYVVQNELSNARNPNNMGMLATMFQTKPKESATHLAEIYQEFLLQREDVLRTLRVFLRELVKMLRYDINLMVFCKTLLDSRDDLTPQIQSSEFRDRIFYSIVDLICFCMFLSVSPQIREANVSLRSGRDTKGSTVLHLFYAQMSQIQFEALTWMHEIVPVLYKPNPNDFTLTFHKMLLLDVPEAYSKGDLWPPESERASLLRMVSEIPLQQNSILRILLIGITKEIPFSIPDTMEIIDQLVRRAASIRNIDFIPLDVDKLEIIDLLFKMSEYHHPDNIVLPVNYEPPKLAISSLYWKTWIILLLISAHNPSIFGRFCWEQYPMLRTLMEMCITNQIVQAKPNEEELQVATIERSHILEFETHLAAATSKVVITEQNSLLLSQLILMDPMGVARRPPNHILEQIQTLNITHRLGHLLCRSRKPDLLLEIIQRQGTSQSMPWLADLVQNSDGDFNHLPVQCLCEFLLSNSSGVIGENAREMELLQFLQKVVGDENGDHQIICEILEYFLRRLSSTSNQSRQSAIRGLKLLLKIFQSEDDPVPIESNNADWLIRFLPMVPSFIYVRPILIVQLRAACQVENCPELVMTYIQFIAAHTLQDSEPDMLEHVMDMSQLIVERSTIFSYIIPTLNDQNENRFNTLNCLFVMFNNFLVKLREYKSSQTFPEYPDLLLVQFADETQCHIHLNIIQAFVILLSHSSIIPGASQILDYWFPENASPPQAFNIETSEPVQILPDWLKLKMIRSSVDRLVDAALQDLTPDQIVLFVQNFGTPINSMSKLLARLDRAVIEQCEAVNSAILNKTYLAQMIEIQQMRGAKNGHISVQALELRGQIIGDPPKTNVSVMEPLEIDFKVARSRTTSENKPASKTTEIEETVEVILTNPTMNKAHLSKFRKMIQRLLGGNKNSKSHEYTLSKVLNYLSRMLKNPQGQFLFKNIVQNPQNWCFFRSLLSLNPDKFDNRNYMLYITDEVLKWLNPANNSLLLQMLVKERQNFIPTNAREAVSSQNVSSDLMVVLQTTKVSDVEGNGKRILKQTNSRNMIDVISSVLKSFNIVKSEDGNQFDKKGLLVDWLAEADSELISFNQELQMDLLFNKSLKEFRPYLLSLLSHQSSWCTMHRTINKLLDEFNPTYDPSSVLDLVDAVIRNPKLWQGRDKAVSKHEQIEYIVCLDEKQVLTFVDYILNEDDADKLSARVKLLLQCIDSKYDYLQNIASYVQKKNQEKSKMFLQQLYLNIPPMKFMMPQIEGVYDADLRGASGCTGDKFSHFILTAISSLSNHREYQHISQEMELIVRKLAASHPSLLLRELSVLAALLQGRAHMDLHVLRGELHIHLFHQVLGILEILQPTIFVDNYQSGLHSALECYFTLLRHHGHSKEVYSIMYRFMDLLQSYITASAPRALKFIENYTDLMQDLAHHHYDMGSLQQLVQGLSLLKHKTESTFIEKAENNNDEPQPGCSKDIDTKPKLESDTDSRGAAAVILAPYTKQEIAPQHWAEIMHELKVRNYDDILVPLIEVDNVTIKRPALLEDVFDKILKFVVHPSANVRNTAHILLARHLKQSPGNFSTNSSSLTTYIQCLYSEDTAVVQSALEKVTEYVLCLQEYAPQILNSVFSLGITSKINTYAQIRKCILALKKQHAC